MEAAQQKAQELESDFIESLYTIAQVQARLGHREDAYLALDRALGAGFNDLGRLRSDDAFQDFRSEALFNSLVQRARRNASIQAWENPEREAVKNGIRAIAFRRHAKEIGPLYQHLFEPWKQPEVPDGIRVFVAGKQRGKLVIG